MAKRKESTIEVGLPTAKVSMTSELSSTIKAIGTDIKTINATIKEKEDTIEEINRKLELANTKISELQSENKIQFEKLVDAKANIVVLEERFKLLEDHVDDTRHYAFCAFVICIIAIAFLAYELHAAIH